MTDREPPADFDIGHPAPGRAQVGAISLLIAFSLAPLAWSIQLAAVSSIAGVACLSESGIAVAESRIGWAEPAAEWINIGALVLALAGLAFSGRNLYRTLRAAKVPSGGVMKAGEGRAHWMAVGGFLAGLLFFFAIGFNTIAIFWKGLCPV